MLVINRDEQERITITDADTGDVLEIVVLKLFTNSVRLGFSGPKKFKIWRSEIQERIENGESES